MRMVPHGRWSGGGASQLLQTADGWIALSLARESDYDLVPAWLGTDDLAVVARETTAELVERASLLGLPVGGVNQHMGPAVVRTTINGTPRAGARVIDLSALWAGPLAGRLLAEAGCEVLKVESTTRPDGARLGSPDFFDRLNGRKQQRSVEFEREALVALLQTANVVIESSRPRALEQLGIYATDFLESGLHVWASITAYGRNDPRVGFGDDAAAAGGLVRPGPSFLGDAIADPLTGLRAAHAINEARKQPEPCLLDISLAGVAREIAGKAEE